ncbi:836_t:CDS:2 [Paraglomus brasilianum]|uniref:836_t:CDS:1 n=1 Tax=Paraglomus brasilianum TaxID=144538 RepID=A0A9N9DBV3_9GLOM|nr:836_t:CDS:2 [Paraglomus brasilianum]
MSELLPRIPDSWDKDLTYQAHGTLSECVIRELEPVGQYYLAHARRKLHNYSFLVDERTLAENEVVDVDEADYEEEEEETPELLKRDPKDWKEQDHYAVLGLSKSRWRATEDDIRRAHRKKVLKHHPDKKASSGNTNDDSFFKCIQKAYEILTDPIKRRQYDSIDPLIDDSVPKTKGDFFQIYGPVFEREARFSNKTPVPMLGDMNSTLAEVETFYDFWYNFDSWRSFEYFDKEDADSTEKYVLRKMNHSVQ